MSETSPLDPLPVCLGCWRRRFGMDEVLPAPPQDARRETCQVCGGPTTHGLYLLRGKPTESAQLDDGLVPADGRLMEGPNPYGSVLPDRPERFDR